MPGRTLREIVRIIASRFVGMIVIFVLVVGAVAVATWQMPREYRSEAQLLAKPTKAVSPLESTSVSLREEVQLFVGYQRELIMSDYVLATAMMRLEGKKPLPPSKAETASLYAAGDVDKYIAANGEKLRDVRKRVSVVTPGGSDVAFTRTFRVRVDWPEERAEAARLGSDPRKLAAERACKMNANILDAYMRRYAELESKRTRDQAKFLKDKSLKDAEHEVQETTKAMTTFAKQVKGDMLAIISMDARGAGGFEPGVAGLLCEGQSEINRINADLAEVRALLKEVRRLKSESDLRKIAGTDAMTKANPAMKEIESKMVELKLKLAYLKARYADRHRELIATADELKKVHAELKTELGRQAVRLENRELVLVARLADVSKQVNKDRDRLDTVAVLVPEYQRLRDNRDVAARIFETEQQRYTNALTAQNLAQSPMLVSRLDDPSRPDSGDPHRPLVLLNMVIAIAAGLVLSVVYAFASDHFDHTIKSIDEAERYIDVPVLGSFPKLGRRIIRSS